MGNSEIRDVQPRWTTEAYFNDFRVLITLQFKSPKDVVELINALESAGFSPAPHLERRILPTPEATEIKEEVGEKETPKESEVPPVCRIHNKPMVQRQGQYGKFWACPVKEGGMWCKYRPPKK